ncbi:MAG: response regulator, partial [Alphaproteobacteria bacterium]
GGDSDFDALLEKPVRAGKLHELLYRVANEQMKPLAGTAGGAEAVRLPVVSANATVADSAEASQPSEAPVATDGLRVLLAEDNPVNQKLSCALLDRFGHTTVTVDNGEKAVAAVVDGDFDVVLMDIQMPELDGIGATRRIRALDDSVRANVPIIAMTANTMPGDRETYIAAGMNDYVAKPVDRLLLRDALEA